MVPRTTGAYFSVHPVAVLGVEGEGNAGVLAVDTPAVLVYVMGGRPPVSGDDLICRFARDRWVADRLAAVVSYYYVSTGCDCPSVPAVLLMTVANPALDGGMFQNCTIRYVPVPAGYHGLNIADAAGNAYISDQSFVDPYGDTFQWYLYCHVHQFFLTRVFAHSIFGSPFEDSARFTYTLPTPGIPSAQTDGNTCSPFRLSNGQVYAGGDPSTRITITG